MRHCEEERRFWEIEYERESHRIQTKKWTREMEEKQQVDEIRVMLILKNNRNSETYYYTSAK